MHTLPCHCEGVRSTLKTLAYDCGNPGQYVCGRYARSAFLFTGSPRFARDDKGEEVFFLEFSDHPALRAPLQWRGTGYVPSRVKVPLCGGVGKYWAPRDLSRGWLARGGYCTPPPVMLRMTPPALEPPTQTMFARDPVAVGIIYTLNSILYTLIKKRGGPRFLFQFAAAMFVF